MALGKSPDVRRGAMGEGARHALPAAQFAAKFKDIARDTGFDHLALIDQFCYRIVNEHQVFLPQKEGILQLKELASDHRRQV